MYLDRVSSYLPWVTGCVSRCCKCNDILLKKSMANSKLLHRASEKRIGKTYLVDLPISRFDTDIEQSMPVHSMTWGHLLAVKPIMDSLPGDAHPFYVFGEVSRKFSGLYYLDLWPFSPPFLIVTSATAAAQVTQHTSLAFRSTVGTARLVLADHGRPYHI